MPLGKIFNQARTSLLENRRRSGQGTRDKSVPLSVSHSHTSTDRRKDKQAYRNKTSKFQARWSLTSNLLHHQLAGHCRWHVPQSVKRITSHLHFVHCFLAPAQSPEFFSQHHHHLLTTAHISHAFEHFVKAFSTQRQCCFAARKMFTSQTINLVNFFYPVGNTPAVSLTQSLPSAKDAAEILLLGCGDLRNILFTAHVDG